MWLLSRLNLRCLSLLWLCLNFLLNRFLLSFLCVLCWLNFLGWLLFLLLWVLFWFFNSWKLFFWICMCCCCRFCLYSTMCNCIWRLRVCCFIIYMRILISRLCRFLIFCMILFIFMVFLFFLFLFALMFLTLFLFSCLGFSFTALGISLISANRCSASSWNCRSFFINLRCFRNMFRIWLSNRWSFGSSSCTRLCWLFFLTSLCCFCFTLYVLTIFVMLLFLLLNFMSFFFLGWFLICIKRFSSRWDFLHTCCVWSSCGLTWFCCWLRLWKSFQNSSNLLIFCF